LPPGLKECCQKDSYSVTIPYPGRICTKAFRRRTGGVRHFTRLASPQSCSKP
jgi:hypothetical protein